MLGKYIKRYRIENNLTQFDFIVKIQSLDVEASFKLLDEITLSRWENERTRPSLKKQVLLMVYMGFKHDLNTFITPDKVKLESLLSKRYKDNFLGSDNPYLNVSSHNKVTVRSSKKIPSSRLKHYSAYYSDIHGVPCDSEYLQILNENLSNINFHEIYSPENYIIGHLISFQITDDYSLSVINEKLGFKLSFADDDLKGSIYITSMHASCKDIFHYQNKLVYDLILESNKFPKYIFAKCFYPELANFYEAIGGDVCHKGPISTHGMKYLKCHYRWLMYRINVIDLISSKLFYFNEKFINETFINKPFIDPIIKKEEV